jgi:hypothetical protein
MLQHVSSLGADLDLAERATADGGPWLSAQFAQKSVSA